MASPHGRRARRCSAPPASTTSAGRSRARPPRARGPAPTSDPALGGQTPNKDPGLPPGGQPYDFVSAPLDIRQPPFSRAVETLAAEDPYVAALVAQHAITVYRRFAAD